MALKITKENFESVVVNSDKPVLVDFWAEWCGPCRMLGPVVEQLADELKDSVVVGKINIDEEPDLAAQFRVLTIPTVIAFKNGSEVKRSVGVQPKEALKQLLD